MSFLACSGVSVFTVGGTYGFLFIVLFPLLFSPLNGIVPRVLGVEDQWDRFCYEIGKSRDVLVALKPAASYLVLLSRDEGKRQRLA